MDRRSLMGLAALALSGLPGRAFAAASAPDEIIPLWPFGPPGGQVPALTPQTVEQSKNPDIQDRRISGIARPTLTVVRPALPDGSALLIVPGGGYSIEAIDLEGLAPAALFAAHGITTFVLTYRLPGEGWKKRADVPLQDAQRAMRIIRARGLKDYELEPSRIGVLGFSAGGHLAGSLATRFESKVYAPVDEDDIYDPRPSFAALLYPVITMLAPYAHESSRVKLLGTKVTVAQRTAYSVEHAVTVATPPTFLCAANDDPEVPLDNTFRMFGSLRAAKVPAELHVFDKGGHGFGLGEQGQPVSQWPELFLRWGASHGYFRNAL
jgi:acetyl esterase/lipase